MLILQQLMNYLSNVFFFQIILLKALDIHFGQIFHSIDLFGVKSRKLPEIHEKKIYFS